MHHNLNPEPPAIRVGGRNLDSLAVASLLRRENGSLVVEKAENTAIISGSDLVISWRCEGRCQADAETAIEFSIDADVPVPYHDLGCFAYDLGNDPKQHHRIRPQLVGPDGSSKKVSIPFHKPLARNERFNVLLTAALPGCMSYGVDYYTATFSFGQRETVHCTTNLIFLDDLPRWVSVSERKSGGSMTELQNLQPTSKRSTKTEYRERIPNASPTSARVYLFERRMGHP